MSRFPFLIFVTLACTLLSSCALLEEGQAPKLTPLEIQSLQTREYKASKERVFASVVTSFQDQGYTILTADQTTGLITAKSLLQKSLLQSDHRYFCTAFVDTVGSMTRVRLSFIKKETDNLMSSSHKEKHNQEYKSESQVLDASLYQNAFERIESNLFIRSNY